VQSSLYGLSTSRSVLDDAVGLLERENVAGRLTFLDCIRPHDYEGNHGENTRSRLGQPDEDTSLTMEGNHLQVTLFRKINGPSPQ
jgi:hypothetical protein